MFNPKFLLLARSTTYIMLYKVTHEIGSSSIYHVRVLHDPFICIII